MQATLDTNQRRLLSSRVQRLCFRADLCFELITLRVFVYCKSSTIELGSWYFLSQWLFLRLLIAPFFISPTCWHDCKRNATTSRSSDPPRGFSSTDCLLFVGCSGEWSLWWTPKGQGWVRMNLCHSRHTWRDGNGSPENEWLCRKSTALKMVNPVLTKDQNRPF
jgi:hypothetical protein